MRSSNGACNQLAANVRPRCLLQICCEWWTFGALQELQRLAWLVLQLGQPALCACAGGMPQCIMQLCLPALSPTQR